MSHAEKKESSEATDLITSSAYVYPRVSGWGSYYLSTVMDDFSRFIIAYKLGPTMATTDVTETLDEVLALTGVRSVRVRHRPRLLSDNGPAYVYYGRHHEVLSERDKSKQLTSNGGTRSTDPPTRPRRKP